MNNQYIRKNHSNEKWRHQIKTIFYILSLMSYLSNKQVDTHDLSTTDFSIDIQIRLGLPFFR